MGSISFIKKSRGGSAKSNIFMQEAEPAIKEGIWLKSNKKANAISVVSALATEGTWDTTSKATIPAGMNVGNSVQIGDTVYLFGLDAATPVKAFKYNMATNEYTAIADLPYNVNTPSVITDGIDIYVLGGSGDAAYKILKYVVAENRYEPLKDCTEKIGKVAVLSNKDIFFINESGTSNNVIFKYNLDTQETTVLKTKADGIPVSLKYINAVGVGDYIYIFGGDGSTDATSKYNMKDNTITKLSNPPFALGRKTLIALVGNTVYVLANATTNFCKYNIETDKYEELPATPSAISARSTAVKNNVIYIFGATDAYNKTYTYTIPSYPANTIIVIQGTGKNKTQLYSDNSITGRVLFGFDDAVYSDTNNTIDNNISLYYGTGKAWQAIREVATPATASLLETAKQVARTRSVKIERG